MHKPLTCLLLGHYHPTPLIPMVEGWVLSDISAYQCTYCYLPQFCIALCLLTSVCFSQFFGYTLACLHLWDCPARFFFGNAFFIVLLYCNIIYSQNKYGEDKQGLSVHFQHVIPPDSNIMLLRAEVSQ